jgi:nucleoside-diphosphate-sugar epimerase
MKALVTGATGGLGRNLVERLYRDGHDVVATGRNRTVGAALSAQGIRFEAADITDIKALISLMRGCEVVFHCAAMSSPFGTRQAFFEANVVGTEAVATAAAYNLARLVHVSTPSIYFDYRDRYNISEFEPLPKTFANTYAATKYQAEQRVLQNVKSVGLSAIILRPRGIFGPHDQVLFPRILNAAKDGKVPLINGGQTVVDLTYVDNVVDAMLLAAEAHHIDQGEAFNITNGQGVILAEALKTVFEHLGLPFKTKQVPHAVAKLAVEAWELKARITGREPRLTRYSLGVLRYDQTLDITRAKNNLGYAPKVSIADGLRRFAKWYKAQQ